MDTTPFTGNMRRVGTDADLTTFAATGQGFTGLIYVYNPTSGSELQYFCSGGVTACATSDDLR